MPTHALNELLQYTQDHGGTQAPWLATFVPAYFDNTDPGEIEDRGAATLFAIANAHWRLLESVRAPQFEKVRVFNPTDAPTNLTIDGRTGEVTDLAGEPTGERFDGRTGLRAHQILTIALDEPPAD